MGRDPKPLKNHSGRFLIDYPLKDQEKYTYMEKVRAIMRRETLSFNQIATAALSEYVDRHYYGNSQTLLSSYEPGGIKSEGQLEQGIVKHFTDKHLEGWYIYLRDIVAELIHLGFSGDKLAPAQRRVVDQLLENKVKIII